MNSDVSEQKSSPWKTAIHGTNEPVIGLLAEKTAGLMTSVYPLRCHQYFNGSSLAGDDCGSLHNHILHFARMNPSHGKNGRWNLHFLQSTAVQIAVAELWYSVLFFFKLWIIFTSYNKQLRISWIKVDKVIHTRCTLWFNAVYKLYNTNLTWLCLSEVLLFPWEVLLHTVHLLQESTGDFPSMTPWTLAHSTAELPY